MFKHAHISTKLKIIYRNVILIKGLFFIMCAFIEGLQLQYEIVSHRGLMLYYMWDCKRVTVTCKSV